MAGRSYLSLFLSVKHLFRFGNALFLSVKHLFRFGSALFLSVKHLFRGNALCSGNFFGTCILNLLRAPFRYNVRVFLSDLLFFSIEHDLFFFRGEDWRL